MLYDKEIEESIHPPTYTRICTNEIRSTQVTYTPHFCSCHMALAGICNYLLSVLYFLHPQQTPLPGRVTRTPIPEGSGPFAILVHLGFCIFSLTSATWHSGTKRCPKAAVLNLWGATPLGIKWPFHGGCLRLLESTDIYFMIHNSSKTSVMK